MHCNHTTIHVDIRNNMCCVSCLLLLSLRHQGLHHFPTLNELLQQFGCTAILEDGLADCPRLPQAILLELQHPGDFSTKVGALLNAAATLLTDRGLQPTLHMFLLSETSA